MISFVSELIDWTFSPTTDENEEGIANWTSSGPCAKLKQLQPTSTRSLQSSSKLSDCSSGVILNLGELSFTQEADRSALLGSELKSFGFSYSRVKKIIFCWQRRSMFLCKSRLI